MVSDLHGCYGHKLMLGKGKWCCFEKGLKKGRDVCEEESSHYQVSLLEVVIPVAPSFSHLRDSEEF